MRILIADDEQSVRRPFCYVLGEDHTVVEAKTSAEVLNAFDEQPFDLAIVDLHLDHHDRLSGMRLLKRLIPQFSETIFAVITGNDDDKLIAECFSLGISDYLIKPVPSQHIVRHIARIQEQYKRIQNVRLVKSKLVSSVKSPTASTSFESKSPGYQKLLRDVSKIATSPLNASVLIRGESGSGKEFIAQHLASTLNFEDKRKPFISVNCATFTNLAESELFGHRKGAFTGANEHRVGLLESASDGILFFDEVGTLSYSVQEKLLRAIENRVIMPLGSIDTVRINCRFVFATNEPLEEMAREGKFRPDLLQRIKVLELRVPPLRERREDVLGLIAAIYQKEALTKPLSPQALELCQDYGWPGNVRELKNVLFRANIFTDSDEISAEELKIYIGTDDSKTFPIELDKLSVAAIGGRFTALTAAFESKLIDLALKEAGSESGAAKILGIPRSTLNSKLSKLNSLQ